MEEKEALVISAMKDAGKPVRPGDIAKKLGIDSKEVSKIIKKIKGKGRRYISKKVLLCTKRILNKGQGYTLPLLYIRTTIMDLGKLYTTAMGVMPHTDVDRALELAMSLDVPFWPQLPLYNFYEDMYVQASENFPGIILDTQNRTIRFSKDKFYEELPNIIENYENEDIFDISSKYSVVYPKFLKKRFESISCNKRTNGRSNKFWI